MGLKATGQYRSLLKKKLIDTGLLVEDRTDLLIASSPNTIINFENITCHRQHCSYWIDFKTEQDFNSRRTISILIDPGHGGVDPGASHYGFFEKNITLAFAYNIADVLFRKNMQVQLTRSTDKFLSLKERSFIVSKVNPDCFLSLHADSYIDSSVSGVSVFLWGNERGRQSALNKHLLESNEDFNFLGVSQESSQRKLLPILNDLVYKVRGYNTDLLSSIVMQQLSEINLHHRDIQKAPFYVLNNPLVPSLLIELGFLSHRPSALMLGSEPGRQRLSKMIAQGIIEYINQVYLISDNNASFEYIVQKGDTLWSISRAYKVSIEDIYQRNNLKSDFLKVGQKILL